MGAVAAMDGGDAKGGVYGGLGVVELQELLGEGEGLFGVIFAFDGEDGTSVSGVELIVPLGLVAGLIVGAVGVNGPVVLIAAGGAAGLCGDEGVELGEGDFIV